METLNRKSVITVIGGANTDIGGGPAASLRLYDSNPGVITLRQGGVGRNIAHNLRLLGEEVRLIAAVGDDLFGRDLRAGCEALGIDCGRMLTVPGARSSTYLYVTNAAGDMHVGIADMEIVQCVTPAYLEPLMDEINASAAVVVDANLSGETLDFLAGACTAPLYADPVSTAKAPRLQKLLPRLTAFKPNALEAALLTGENYPGKAARALLERGVRRVFVSLGSGGMLAAEEGESLRLPCAPGPIVNTTGAGD
ncbi:MAG: MarR family transcriptional regulator, partial [Oscillospiraceae bacterium]|nr:MarR family transcriptional regulator [Oscillospiraceae bacterium]